MKRAVFFDRDGTLIEEKDYLNDPQQIEIIPGAPEAIRLVKNLGFLAIVITNQSGVARGYVSEEKLEEINLHLLKAFEEKGAYLDDLFVCPHGPEDDCMCRKPRPGLLVRAAIKYGINLKISYMIGDRDSDVGAIASVGGKGILVLTGYGEETWRRWRWGHKPNFVAKNVLEGVYWILSQEIKEKRTMLDEELLKIMVCPICRKDLHLLKEGLVCEECKLLYPIEEGIPIMLPEEAIKLEDPQKTNNRR